MVELVPPTNELVNGANVGTNAATYSTNSLTSAATVQVIMTGNAGCIHPLLTHQQYHYHDGTTHAYSCGKYQYPFNTICAGTNAAFIATAQNAGSSPTYQWQVNGSNTGTNSNTGTTIRQHDGGHARHQHEHEAGQSVKAILRSPRRLPIVVDTTPAGKIDLQPQSDGNGKGRPKRPR